MPQIRTKKKEQRAKCHKVPLGHNAVDRHKAVDLQYGMHGLGWPQWALCDLGIMGAVAANQEYEINLSASLTDAELCRYHFTA